MFIFKFLDKVHASRQEWLLQNDRVPNASIALNIKPDNQPAENQFSRESTRRESTRKKK